MENKIKIAEMLENCPKGMKLYSPIFGEVYLDEIRPHLAIVVTTDKEQGNSKEEFLYDGRYGMNGECMLFPSKDKTTWNGFKRPFKDGDILTNKYGKPFILKKYLPERDNVWTYCGIDCEDKFNKSSNNWTYANSVRFATEEEKQKLFDAIKANGYKWNAETKTLEKLVPNKFDITTLKPFESRVLVRHNNDNKWCASFFSHIDGDFHSHCYKFVTVAGKSYPKMIPYEGNEHLLNTTDDCDEFYKTWLDE